MNAMLDIQIRILGQQAAAQIKALQSQINGLKATTQGGTSAMRGFNSAFNLTNLEKFGKNLQWTGRQLEYNFTLPLVIAGTAATKWALDNEKASVRVRKVYGDLGEDVGAELDALDRSFELLSDRFGVSLKETTDIAASWAQAGAAGVALSRGTRATLEAMIIGELDATDATKGLIAVQSAFRLNTLELHDALAQLNIIENQTSIEFGDLIDVIVRAGGSARTAGVDIRHLSAMAATLVPAAGSASQAGNSLRTIFSRMLVPTKEASQVLAQIGIDIQDASWQAKSGVGRVEALAIAFEKLSQGQQAVVSSVIASRWQINRFDTLMRDVALGLDEATQAQSAYWRALEATNDQQQASAVYAKELATVLSSSPKAFEILTTNIKNAMAQAILPLLPVLISVLKSVALGVRWFNKLSPSVQQAALSFAVLLALVGPLSRYVGSFILLGTTMGRVFHLMTKGALYFFDALFGLTAAQIENLSVSEAENISYLRKYGLIGGLVRLIKGPFVLAMAIMTDAWRLAMTVSGTFFTQVADLAIYSMSVFIGAMRTGIGVVVGWLGSVLPGAASAMAGAMVSAFSAMGSVIAGVFSATVTLVSNAAAFANAIMAESATFFQAAWAAAVVGVRTLWGALSSAAFAVGRVITAAWWAAVSAFETAWVAGTTLVTRGWHILLGSARIASLLITRLWIAASSLASAAWIASITLIQRGWNILVGAGRLAPWLISQAWQLAAAAAQGAWTIFLAFMQSVPALSRAIWAVITATWTAGYAVLEGLTAGFTAFMEVASAAWEVIIASPWTFAIIAIVAALGALIYFFRDDLVNGIIRAFNALPEGIQSVLLYVIQMIKRFALAVYEWLSYLNPFARHSPSLVDSVTRGMSTILDQYSRLNGVKAIIKEAIQAHNAFLAATGAASTNMQLSEYQSQKADIVAVAPNAGPEIDRVIESIFKMNDALKLVNDELLIQQRLADDMERQINQDMKPYNEAIAANEQAQKKLRLEMLKMEEAGQSIDDLRDRYAALSGLIETMRSRRESLRAAGAGSDVLNTYDNQITALEAQRKAMEGSIAPAEEMSKQLSDLQKQGEILQLEKDVRFDPQLQALDAQKDKVSELESGYRDVNGAISDMESSLRSMSAAARSALSSSGGSASDIPNAVAQFDAASMANFDVPGGTAPPGLGREGDITDIEAFNAELEKELNQALSDMGGFDMFAPFKQMWKSGWQWLVDNVGPYIAPVWDSIKSFWDGLDWGSLGNPFGAVADAMGESGGRLSDVLNTVGDFFASFLNVMQEVWNFLAETFGPIFSWIGDQIKSAGKSIGNELKNWAPMFDKVVEAVTHIANAVEWAFKYIITPIIVVSLGVIMGIWQATWPVMKNILEPIIDAIVGVIRGGLEVIRGIISFVLDVINGDWGAAWDDILTIVDGIWDMIYSVIKYPVDLIIGLIRGLVEGIVGFFTWLWDVLVGHSIIPDMMNAIVWWFNFILAPIKAVWNALWTAIKWAWDNIGARVFSGIKWVLDNVLSPAFNTFKQTVSTVFDVVGSGIKWAWDNVIDPTFTSIKRGIEEVGNKMSWVKDHVIKPVWDGISSIISLAWSGMRKILEGGINFFIDIMNFLISGINTIAGALGLGFSVSPMSHVSLSGGNSSNIGRNNKAGATLYAAGGIPAYDFGSHGGFSTNQATAIVGEGSRQHPEFVIPTDPRYRDRALMLFKQLGARIMGNGGLLGNVWDKTGGKVASGVGNMVGNIVGKAATTGKVFWDLINKARGITGNLTGAVKDVAVKLLNKTIDWGTDKIGDLTKSAMTFFANPIGSLVDTFWANGGTIPNLANGGIVHPRPGGTLVNVGERGRSEAVVSPLPHDYTSGGNTYNFYGDLEFPNITDPNDASKFIENLTSLV